MAQGFTIKIGADTDAYSQGIKTGVIVPTENAQKALEQIGNDKSLSELEGSFRKAQTQSQAMSRQLDRDAKQIHSDFQSSFHQSEQSVTDFGEVAENKLELFAGRARKHATDVKSAITTNIAQAVAGSIDSTASLENNVEGILSGLALALPGPIGAAFGLIGGLIAGTMGQATKATEQASQAQEKAAADWAKAYIDAADKVISAGAQAAKSQEIYTDSDKLKEATQNATDWGVSLENAVAAMSGNQAALQAVGIALDERKAKIEADKAAVEASRDANGQYTESSQILVDQLSKDTSRIDEATSSYTNLTKAQSDGQEAAQNFSDTLKLIIATAPNATEQIDQFGNALITLPNDGGQIVISADTGQATLNLDKFKGDIDTLPKSSTFNLDAQFPDVSDVASAWRVKMQAYWDAHPIKINGNVITHGANGGQQLQ